MRRTFISICTFFQSRNSDNAKDLAMSNNTSWPLNYKFTRFLNSIFMGYKSTMHIEDYLNISDDFIADEHISLNVSGCFEVNGNVNINNNGFINIDGEFKTKNNVSLKDNTVISLNGTMEIGGDLTIGEFSIIIGQGIIVLYGKKNISSNSFIGSGITIRNENNYC